MAIGNRWVYDYTNPAEFAVLDRKIQDSIRTSTGLLLFGYSEDVLVTAPPPNQPIAAYAGHRGGTIYFAENRAGAVGPTVPLLASPLTVGHTWFAEVGGKKNSFQIISVAPGLFGNQFVDTVVIARRWDFDAMIDSLWFGRAIGIIKQVTTHGDNISRRQLRSFTAAG